MFKFVGILVAIFVGAFLGNVLWDVIRSVEINWASAGARAAIFTVLAIAVMIFLFRPSRQKRVAQYDPKTKTYSVEYDENERGPDWDRGNR